MYCSAGDNDIFTLNPAEEVTVEQVKQGHRQLIERAHAKGLKIFGCTLTPLLGFPAGDAVGGLYTREGGERKAVNPWIRTAENMTASLTSIARYLIPFPHQDLLRSTTAETTATQMTPDIRKWRMPST